MAGSGAIRSGVELSKLRWAIPYLLVVGASACEESTGRESTETAPRASAPVHGARTAHPSDVGDEDQAPETASAQERVGRVYELGALAREVDCDALRGCVREKVRRHRLFKKTWIDYGSIAECLGTEASEELHNSLTCGSFDIGLDPRFGEPVVVERGDSCHGCVCGGDRLVARYVEMSEPRCKLLGMNPIGSGARYAGCRPGFAGRRKHSCGCAPSDLMCAMECAANEQRAEHERRKTATTSTLHVNSIPASTILLDGRPLGTTPHVGLQVRPGVHTIVFVGSDARKVVTMDIPPGAHRTAAVRF